MKLKTSLWAVAGAAVLLTGAFAQPAMADSGATSTDSSHGSYVYFTAATDYWTVYDESYDGWGAYSRGIWSLSQFYCINEKGYNSSRTCLLGAGGGPVSYNSCLEHNNGATVSYCSGLVYDYAT